MQSYGANKVLRNGVSALGCNMPPAIVPDAQAAQGWQKGELGAAHERQRLLALRLAETRLAQHHLRDCLVDPGCTHVLLVSACAPAD